LLHPLVNGSVKRFIYQEVCRGNH